MRPIYFSGSISGGRDDQAIYARLVEGLRRRGFEVEAGEVTAERPGVPGESLTAGGIFERDLAWMEEVAAGGGAVVAEVTIPSHGVGYEIAAARWRFAIPVVTLFRPSASRRCSAMIAGDPGIQLFEYDLDTLEETLDRVALALASL